MKPLSVRSRESIKTGLAMAVTIGIAVRMEFLEPQWAGFAVAMISLDSAGQSLNKAALRMLGTGVAFVASLTFIGLFPQQRWGLVLALTPYIGLCTYMLTGRSRPYFWFVSAFVCLTIMVHGGTDSTNAFRYAVARVEETALGILVYSLISVFLWPRTSQGDLDAASRALFGTQLALYRAYVGLLDGRGRHEDSRALRLQEAQQLAQLGQSLDAANTDSYEVWELRHAWRRFLQQSTVLAEALGRWRVSLHEVAGLDLPRLLPGSDASLAELARRFAQIERMLAGQPTEDGPRAVEVALAESEVEALSHFQRAALVLLLTQLRRLDEISRKLFDCVREISGSGQIVTKPLREDARPPGLALDLDRLQSVFTVLATMWSGFLIWFYLDPPGHDSFAYNATLWAMVATLAQQRPHALFPGSLIGIVVGGVAYVGVMPLLSSYLELGLMLFVVTAGCFYFFWAPERRGARTLSLSIFLIVAPIANAQTYSFEDFANTSACVLLTIALASAVAYFPRSPRPEKIFLRLLARFFRHAEILMSRLAPEQDRKKGFVGRWQSYWIRNDLIELPKKLAALADRIDYRLLPGTPPEKVQTLVMNLFVLSVRVNELLEARAHVWPDPRLERVVEELRAWRLLAQQQFRLWAEDPSAALDPDASMGERLHARLARMEADLDEAHARSGHEGFRVDYEALYRYLGAFRGLSESAKGYAQVAAAVPWKPWREARF